MITSDNGISIWLRTTKSETRFNHSEPTVSVNQDGTALTVAEVLFATPSCQRKLQLHVEKSPSFSACLCMVISSTVEGYDIHEGNLYMASTETKTSTLLLQRPPRKNPYLRYPRVQPQSNNPNMGAIRLEVYHGPRLRNFHSRKSYGNFKPDWKPSDILTFKFRHQRPEGESLTSDPAPPTKVKLSSQYRAENQGHSDSNIVKEGDRDSPIHQIIPIPTYLRISGKRVRVPSQLKRKRQEPSIISISSDSGEEAEAPPRVRDVNRRIALKSVQATSSASRGRGTTSHTKLQQAEELLAKEQKRNENLQLRMALCIEEKAKWKKKENEQLAAKIKAEKKLMEQQSVGHQDE